MNASRSLALAVAVALAGLSFAPTAVAETKPYTTGADLLLSCEEDLVGRLLAGNYGSVCFDVGTSDTAVDVTIDDAYVDDVGGAIEFRADSGERVGDMRTFCGSASDVSVPDGAQRMDVHINGPVFQLLECGSIGSSTFGDVTATFH